MAESAYLQGDPDDGGRTPFSDDDPDEPELAPNAPAEERLTRLQKKTERMQRALRESKQNAERVKELEAQQAERDRQLAELRGMVAANNHFLARAANDNQKDPYEARLEALNRRRADALQAAQAEIKAGGLTPERQAYYERVAQEIEAERIDVHTERAVERRSAASRAEAGRLVWEQKYPEVYRNERALQYATATYHRRRALGEADTPALVDDIMADAISAFKLGGKPAPSASDKARLGGVPSSGSGGGSRGSDIAMTPELIRMARAAYPDLPEGEAEKRWKAKTGKRMREKKLL
jgi:hypothetical protein